mgnify:CR=1 FL=1
MYNRTFGGIQIFGMTADYVRESIDITSIDITSIDITTLGITQYSPD